MSETTPTFNQINEQLANSDQPASVLVEKHDGSIVTGQVMTNVEGDTKVWLSGSNSESSEQLVPTRIVNAEKLTDEHQAALAEKLAGVALRGAEETVNPYTELLKGDAAKTPPAELPPAQTSDRPGYWQKPTQEQIDNAAKRGFDLTKQEKYHS